MPKNIIPLSVAGIIVVVVAVISLSQWSGEEELLIPQPTNVPSEVSQSPLLIKPNTELVESAEPEELRFTPEEIEQIEETAEQDTYLGTLAAAALRRENKRARREAWEQAQLEKASTNKSTEELETELASEMLRAMINKDRLEPIGEAGLKEITTLFQNANRVFTDKAERLSDRNNGPMSEEELEKIKMEAFEQLGSVLKTEYGVDISTWHLE